jgi:HEAT repeat protein
MPLTIEELRTTAREVMAHGWAGPPAPPAADVADVLSHLDSDDRNVRVAALRVLAFCDDARAADGILRGLDDPMKRVREVAAKSSPRFLRDQRVVDRLRSAVERDETGSARPAVEVLGGMFHSPFGLAAVEPVASALAALVELPKHRRQVLLALLRARTLTDEVRALLQSFVRDGSKDEAVYATRRLDGFRVAHDAELIGDTEARRNADRAWGDVWYWIPVPEERR